MLLYKVICRYLNEELHPIFGLSFSFLLHFIVPSILSYPRRASILSWSLFLRQHSLCLRQSPVSVLGPYPDLACVACPAVPAVTVSAVADSIPCKQRWGKELWIERKASSWQTFNKMPLFMLWSPDRSPQWGLKPASGTPYSGSPGRAAQWGLKPASGTPYTGPPCRAPQWGLKPSSSNAVLPINPVPYHTDWTLIMTDSGVTHTPFPPKWTGS